MSNRRKHDEGFRVNGMALWFVAALYLSIVGLRYVYLTNQIHATGRQIHEMEVELKDIASQNEVAHAKISQLSSRTVLQRRLSEGFIKMQPITDEHIVRVAAKPAAQFPVEVRKVANKGGAR